MKLLKRLVAAHSARSTWSDTKEKGKNYVIKKVKTRDMNPKDLENTENEVGYS
jgi:hypothetical protein